MRHFGLGFFMLLLGLLLAVSFVHGEGGKLTQLAQNHSHCCLGHQAASGGDDTSGK